MKSQGEMNRENMESVVRVKQTKTDQSAIEKALDNQEESMRKTMQDKEEVKKATPHKKSAKTLPKQQPQLESQPLPKAAAKQQTVR